MGVPAVTLSPSNLSFEGVATGTKSSKTVTVTNNQTTPLTFSAIQTSGDFAQTNTCPSALAGNTNCVITVTFAPTATGTRTGTLTIADNAGNSPQIATLQGTGDAANLVSITVQPAIPSIPKGGTQQFTAMGNYSDGATKDLTTIVAWSSSSTAVATLSNVTGSNGLATSVALGTATITATMNPTIGTAALTVSPPRLASLAVSPANPAIARGTTRSSKCWELTAC